MRDFEDKIEEMASAGDWILDPRTADWMWHHIRNSTRLFWPDDERLTYILKVGLDTQSYYRNGTWENDDWKEWTRKMSGLPMTDSPTVPFYNDKVRSARIAGVSYTNIGSWYTFEAQEDTPGSMEFDPIRVPVPDKLVDEVKDWADSYGGEYVRVKGVEFKERFATALDADEAERAAGDLRDVHVRIPDIESKAEARTVFQEAADFAERGVRIVS